MKRITLDVSRWTIYQHRDARGLNQVDSHDNKRVQFEDELFDRLFSGSDVEQLPEAQQDKHLAGWASRTHQACEALPAFQRLANEIRAVKSDASRAALAGLAVEQLMGELAPALKEAQSGVEPPKSVDPGQAKKIEDAMRGMVRRATEQATKKVAAAVDADKALDQFAFGWQPGTDLGLNAHQAGERIRRIAVALQTKPRMQRLVGLIGRFRRIAANKQRSKVRHGCDEISDITVGDDMGRFLPTEFVKLKHPLLRLELYRQMQERSVLQYEMRSSEPKGKGPMVVCLDKSGSMAGDANDWATAVALALGDVAAREGRVFAILSFTTRVVHEAIVRKGEKLDANALDVVCNGGTDIDAAYERAFQIIRDNQGQLGKADIVMITDGGSTERRTTELREQAKAMGVQSFGMAIGVNADCLKPWCDTVQTVEDVFGVDDGLATKLFAA